MSGWWGDSVIWLRCVGARIHLKVAELYQSMTGQGLTYNITQEIPDCYWRWNKYEGKMEILYVTADVFFFPDIILITLHMFESNKLFIESFFRFWDLLMFYSSAFHEQRLTANFSFKTYRSSRVVLNFSHFFLFCHDFFFLLREDFVHLWWDWNYFRLLIYLLHSDIQ